MAEQPDLDGSGAKAGSRMRQANISNISIFDINILMYCIGRPTASSPGFFELQMLVLIQEVKIKICRHCATRQKDFDFVREESHIITSYIITHK